MRRFTAVIQACRHEPLGVEHDVGRWHGEGCVGGPAVKCAAAVGLGVPIGEGRAGLRHRSVPLNSNRVAIIIGSLWIDG